MSNHYGFATHETASVWFSITHEVGNHTYWHAMARDLLDQFETKKERVCALTALLEESHEVDEETLATLAPFAQTLLQESLNEIKWEEIATSLLNGVTKREENIADYLPPAIDTDEQPTYSIFDDEYSIFDGEETPHG